MLILEFNKNELILNLGNNLNVIFVYKDLIKMVSRFRYNATWFDILI